MDRATTLLGVRLGVKMQPVPAVMIKTDRALADAQFQENVAAFLEDVINALPSAEPQTGDVG